MQIENIDISDIKPYSNNPRINEKSIDYVVNSIKEFGFKVPILLDKNKEIVAGHTRYEACKKLGITSVPCIIVNDLTEEQVKAFRLVDNKTVETSDWDYNLLNEELADIIDINMENLGFLEAEMNFDYIKDLTDENYEEPKPKMFCCPNCGYIDIKKHFKEVKE